MKSREDLHIYQNIATQKILDNPFHALWLQPGLGKTIVSLTAIDTLLNWCEIQKPLIVAPRLVTEKTWSDEISEWEHVRHLKLSKVIGTAAQRKKALTAEADIWIISRDNLAWLVDLCGAMWPFDMVVLDESTSFKSHDSVRFRRMKKVMDSGKVRRMIQLTGTPVPNGLMDLWAPIYLLDRGQRLGTTFTGFRGRFFEKNEYEHRYRVRTGAEKSIHNLISDICTSMKKHDWLELKPVHDVTHKIELPNMAQYKQFEADAVLQIPEGEITAVNAGSLYMKLVQFANGAVYDADKKYHVVHDAKLDKLEEVIESFNGAPVIVVYCFQSDAERIQQRIKNVVRLDNQGALAAWNRGEIEVGLGHPASMGYGLNLQYGGHRIIWYGVPNPLEWYQQTLERLDRQGQLQSVINMHLIAQGTVEEKVVQRLIDKTFTQDTLMNVLNSFKAEAEEYRKGKLQLV